MGGGAAWQIACQLTKLIQVYSSSKKYEIFAFSHSNLLKLVWLISFPHSFEELAMCSQNMSCEQCDVSKHLLYRHILKSIVQELKEKNDVVTLPHMLARKIMTL